MENIAKKEETNISTQKTKSPLELALTVSDRIELDSIRLMGCKCELLRMVGPGKKAFEIERESDSKMDVSTNRVLVTTSFTLKTFESETDSDNPDIIIQATFLLIYRATTLEGITEEAIKFFGESNGIFNAWPYWREFTQNTITRMNLPPLTMPVFRIFEPKETEKEQKKVVSKEETIQAE